MYTIYAIIDGEEHSVCINVPEDQLEEQLNRLSRKHEFKNVTRFNLKSESYDVPDQTISGT